jgi:hypothetical protein
MMSKAETAKLKEIVKNLMLLQEYERKQIALILFGSTLTDISRKEAETIYKSLNKGGDA